MDNLSNSQRVFEWLKKMEQLVSDNPIAMPKYAGKTDELIIRLIFEEVAELAGALGFSAQETLSDLCENYDGRMEADYIKQFDYGSTVNVLDALADIEVVMHNATAFYGLSANYQEAFDRVMTSNERKIIDVSQPYQEQWEATKAMYADQGVEVALSPNGVVRDTTGKIRKPYGWQEHDITDLAYPGK